VVGLLQRPTIASGLSDLDLERELTSERSTFDRGDITRAIAGGAGQGAPLSQIVDRVEGWLAGPHAVPLVVLSDGAESRLRGATDPVTSPRADRWTTQDQLTVERDLVARRCAVEEQASAWRRLRWWSASWPQRRRRPPISSAWCGSSAARATGCTSSAPARVPERRGRSIWPGRRGRRAACRSSAWPRRAGRRLSSASKPA
jgi:hypothetical protein